MDRGIITISKMGMVTIPTASVWMTQFEIADLFGVFSCDIRKGFHKWYRALLCVCHKSPDTAF